MAEHFRFFDSADPLNPDRSYNAQQFTDYFKALITTGVMKGAGSELSVSTSGSNMVTNIDTGIAFLMGRYYENDSLLSLTHDTETLGKNRIDRIVVRLDLNTEARFVRAFIKKGVAGASPIPPALTQNNLVYEISLAQVKVIGGQTYINSVDVTDERGNDVICPWAGSKILPNFDDVALQKLIESQLTDGKNTKLYIGDLNLLTDSGFYHTEGAFVSNNAPLEKSSLFRPIVEVFKVNESWVFQRFIYGDNQGTHTYIRYNVLGAWNKWTKLGVSGFASVRKTLNQSVIANGTSVLTFEYVDADTHGFWDTVGKKRFVIPPGVSKVRLWGGFYIESASTNYTWLMAIISKNGSERGKTVGMPTGDSGSWVGGLQVETPVVSVTSGDYFEFKIYPLGGSGSVMNGYNTFFALEVLE